MTALYATPGTLNGEGVGTEITAVLDAVVTQLCPGMSRTDALRTLAVPGAAPDAITDAARVLLANAERSKMVERFISIIVMLERGLPETNTSITPGKAVMLDQAAKLCLEITATEGYWRFMALSLRAECLLILATNTTDKATAASLRAQAIEAAKQSRALQPATNDVGPRPEERASFNRDVIRRRKPPVTTRLFLSQLHDELVPSAATAVEAHPKERALIRA